MGLIPDIKEIWRSELLCYTDVICTEWVKPWNTLFVGTITGANIVGVMIASREKIGLSELRGTDSKPEEQRY